MSTHKLSNISVREFRKFLLNQGLQIIKGPKGRGGHEKWSKPNMERPITIQTHVDPVPEFIIKQVLRYLDISRDRFIKILDGLDRS